jgi:hypothetical protein
MSDKLIYTLLVYILRDEATSNEVPTALAVDITETLAVNSSTCFFSKSAIAPTTILFADHRGNKQAFRAH